MRVVDGYQQFGGWHWETSTVGNVLAHWGVTAPHTGKPFSEAMLLGLSGGIGLMYFVFEYQGAEPTYYVSTRNVRPKADPVADLCYRLGLDAKVQESASTQKAGANLVAALEAGRPAIVWADKLTLPYNAMQRSQFGGWMMPVVVYGCGDSSVLIADRAAGPLTCTPGELAEARAALANTKNRLMVIAPPKQLGDLPTAVLAGIKACIDGYTNPPMSNFGLSCFTKWADLLTSPRDPKGWARLFNTGPRLYNNLRATYELLALEGTGGGGARGLYADFLTEAAVVLGKPALNDVATQFRACADQWQALAEAALPSGVPALEETRELLARRDQLFRAQGQAALDEMHQIGARLGAIKTAMAVEFPLSPAESEALRQDLRERLLDLHAAEQAAVGALQAAIA